MAKISILMATTDGKILKNSSFFQLPFSEEHTALIVNQKIESQQDLQTENPFIKVLNSEEKGISRSRNLALRNCTSDWAHFCDDDVAFASHYFEKIEKALIKYPKTDFYQFQIETPEGESFKNYLASKQFFEFSNWENRQRILLISSVEIVGKMEFIKRNELTFNPEFGIGSGAYPMGEEALFLMDGLDKRARFTYVPEVLVIHPKESSGKKLEQKQLQTLGILFRRVFGWASVLFIPYYALKKRKILQENQISIKQAIRWMNGA